MLESIQKCPGKLDHRKIAIYEPFHEGMNMYNASAKWYNLIFLLRRTVFTLFAVYVFEMPLMQAYSLVVFSLSYIIFLASTDPFEEKRTN